MKVTIEGKAKDIVDLIKKIEGQQTQRRDENCINLLQQAEKAPQNNNLQQG